MFWVFDHISLKHRYTEPATYKKLEVAICALSVLFSICFLGSKTLGLGGLHNKVV